MAISPLKNAFKLTLSVAFFIFFVSNLFKFETTFRRTKALLLPILSGNSIHAVTTSPYNEDNLHKLKCSLSQPYIGPTIALPLEQYPDFNQFLEGPPLAANNGSVTSNTTNFAVCEYLSNLYYGHFPHSFQQLLSCWSWWQANPGKKKVLVFGKAKISWWEAWKYFVHKVKTKWKTQPFLEDFLDMLPEKLNVTVTKDAPPGAPSVKWKKVDKRNLSSGRLHYSMHSPEDAKV